MSHCTVCGAELTEKMLEKEGRIVPFCPECGEFRFPLFNVNCSMIVMNPDLDQICLIRQYGVKEHILVAGFVNKGDNAEDTAVREVKEELGLDVIALRFNKSQYFPKTNNLMLNFGVMVDSMDLSQVNRDEVTDAEWFTFEEAKDHIMKGSLASRFLFNHLNHFEENWGDWRRNLLSKNWDPERRA